MQQKVNCAFYCFLLCFTQFSFLFLRSGGNLPILKHALEIGFDFHKTVRICSYAALGGNLDVLQWLRANGCPWDEFTCSQAALGVHLDVLQWARANGCP